METPPFPPLGGEFRFLMFNKSLINLQQTLNGTSRRLKPFTNGSSAPQLIRSCPVALWDGGARRHCGAARCMPGVVVPPLRTQGVPVAARAGLRGRGRSGTPGGSGAVLLSRAGRDGAAGDGGSSPVRH